MQLHRVILSEDSNLRYSFGDTPAISNNYYYDLVHISAPLPEDVAARTRTKTVSNPRDPMNVLKGKMLDETKELLDKFFYPYNKMLAELIGDKRFLWKWENKVSLVSYWCPARVQFAMWLSASGDLCPDRGTQIWMS